MGGRRGTQPGISGNAAPDSGEEGRQTVQWTVCPTNTASRLRLSMRYSDKQPRIKTPPGNSGFSRPGSARPPPGRALLHRSAMPHRSKTGRDKPAYGPVAAPPRGRALVGGGLYVERLMRSRSAWQSRLFWGDLAGSLYPSAMPDEVAFDCDASVVAFGPKRTSTDMIWLQRSFARAAIGSLATKSTAPRFT